MGLVGSLERRWNGDHSESEAAAILEASKTGDKFARLNKVFKKSIHEDYELTRTVVGTGFSGPVRLGTHKLTGRSAAIKRYDKLAADAERIEYLKSEAEIYLTLDHPNICKLFGIYEDKRHLWLVMEYCQGQELYHRLLEKQVYSEADASELVRQMLEAIHYLHSHSIVHRDLKLENWLYESSGTDTGRLKLIDFGFSRTWNPKRSKMMEACCGSLTYVSPDTLSGSYTNACDMWSLGVIVYFLLVGVPPFFGTENVLIDRITRGAYSMDGIRWRRISEEAKLFVRTLLAVDPHKRLTSRQALDHPWISNCAERVRMRYAHPIDYRVLNSMRQYAVASHLKRAALTMMAYTLTTKEIEELATIFHRFDRNQNGRISLANFKEVMLENFSISTREIEQLFNAMGSMQQKPTGTGEDDEDDAEGDLEEETGVCYSDFVAALLQTRIQFHQDIIREAFVSLDADRSGYITTEDLRSVIGNSFFEGADVDEVIQAADVNGDGRIDYEEFLQAVLAETKEILRYVDNDEPDPVSPGKPIASPLSASSPVHAFAGWPDRNRGGGPVVHARGWLDTRGSNSAALSNTNSDTTKRRGRFLKQLGGFVDSSLVVHISHLPSPPKMDFHFRDEAPGLPQASEAASSPRQDRSPAMCEQTLIHYPNSLCSSRGPTTGEGESLEYLPRVSPRADQPTFNPPSNRSSLGSLDSTSPPRSPRGGPLSHSSPWEGAIASLHGEGSIIGSALRGRQCCGNRYEQQSPSRAKPWDSRLLSRETPTAVQPLRAANAAPVESRLDSSAVPVATPSVGPASITPNCFVHPPSEHPRRQFATTRQRHQPPLSPQRAVSPERERPNSRWLRPSPDVLDASGSETYGPLAARQNACKSVRAIDHPREPTSSDEVPSSSHNARTVAVHKTNGPWAPHNGNIEASPNDRQHTKRQETENLYFDFDLII